MSAKLEKDIRRAAKTEGKSGSLVTDPLTQFNLSLRNGDLSLNPDWHPTQVHEINRRTSPRLQVPELSRRIKVETGQKIDTLLLNGDRLEADDRKRGLVYITEFDTSINDGPCGYRLRALAEQLGCPILGLDNPSIGKSSRYTKEQYKALSENQDFGPTAEALVSAIEATGMQEISLVGVSMGGWAAPVVARLAKEKGIKVNDIIMVAAPGAE